MIPLPPPPRARWHGRRTYAGELCGTSLHVAAGAWQKQIDKAGNVVAETHDRSRRLWAEIGDVLIVSARNGDGLAALEVVRVGPSGFTFEVRVVGGELGDGVCWVLAGDKLRARRQVDVGGGDARRVESA